MKNKKKYIFIITILLLCSIIMYLLNENHDLKENSNNYENNKVTKRENMLSMMLETEANSGNYEMTTRETWPTDGYVFNTELSKCENGGELSWDDINKRVVMSGNVSDKCYIYFDVEMPPTIANTCTSGTNLASCIKTFGDKGSAVSNIYHHDASLTNGAGDNSYRFAGASSDVNNYVCFGSTQNPCPTDNLYRIIGVFGDKVKLIKSDYATSTLLGADGDYSKMYTANTDWDNSAYKGNNLANIAAYNWNKSKQNTWSLSKLNTTNLNTNFITNIGADWAAKIAETTWKVGGNTYANIAKQPAKTAYQNEVVKPVPGSTSSNGETEHPAKIGLMYASDYGFAAEPSAWTANLNTYNGDTIKNVNWMYMGLYEWMISRDAGNSYYALDVYDIGSVGYDLVGYTAYAVRPVFYLSSSVNYASGSGSAADPISIN